jgi:hypothetical protein
MTKHPAFKICVLVVGLATIFSSSAIGEERIQYSRSIRPILAEKCFVCHGPDANQRAADLRLDVEADAKDYAIVEGQPDESEFFARVSSHDADERMPPPDSGKELTEDEVDVLRRWIEQGAPYEGHWSFVPPKRLALPRVDDASWVRGAIDRFVLARLEAEQLKPSPEADRYTLIRRLSLDLTGLPPSIDQVDAFVQDTSDDAYEKVVDRLLQSDRFGEHMARYWLDAARYADTNGYQYDLEREQWVWRDWVINAFNTNLPFDRFTTEQIAGDLLPDATNQQKLATAFHRNHPITIEGGVIDEEYRTEYVIDRVVTTSTVWLGLTMTCSRCHDHKYDPISQRDFYSFFAFFNNVPERGLNGFDPRIKAASPIGQGQLEKLESQIASARRDYDQLVRVTQPRFEQWERQVAAAQVDSWAVIVPEQMKSAGGATLTVQDDHSVVASGPNPAEETYEVVLRTDAKRVSAIRLEALVDASTVNGGTGRGSNGNFVLSEFEVDVASTDKPGEFEQVALARAEADYSQKDYHVALAIDGKIDRTGWAVDGHSKVENRTATFVFRQPVGYDTGTILRIRMIHKYGGSHHIARFRLAAHMSDVPPLAPGLALILDKPPAKRSPAETSQLREWLLQRFGSADVKAAAGRLKDLERQRDQLISNMPATMVMAEMANPRKAHVLYRGEYDKPREEVQPGTPEALPPMPDNVPRNRLGLARWLVMPDHPLTARVAVNRFWQQLFGNGIVKTTEDFGAQGDWPSHPELLDWLAVEFVESKWDVKALLKKMVMSATYRQSSSVTPQLLAADPENRLLARGPRMRLDAEVIRDSALFSAGLLSEQIGGPSVFPYHPPGLWQEINNRPGYSRTYKQDAGEKLFRRSLYTFWKRTLPPPSMAAFDAPGREFCRVRRSRTNTPLQAFVLLHDPQFVEAARHLAGRMLTEAGPTSRERLVHGFRLCQSRPPTETELAVLSEIADKRITQYRADLEAARQLVSVGDTPVEKSFEEAELAAWTTIGRMLMNVSEFVTKP